MRQNLEPFSAEPFFADAIAVFVASSVWIDAMVRTLENGERRVEADAVVVDVVHRQHAGGGFDDNVVLATAKRAQQSRLRGP